MISEWPWNLLLVLLGCGVIVGVVRSSLLSHWRRELEKRDRELATKEGDLEEERRLARKADARRNLTKALLQIAKLSKKQGAIEDLMEDILCSTRDLMGWPVAYAFRLNADREHDEGELVDWSVESFSPEGKEWALSERERIADLQFDLNHFREGDVKSWERTYEYELVSGKQVLGQHFVMPIVVSQKIELVLSFYSAKDKLEIPEGIEEVSLEVARSYAYIRDRQSFDRAHEKALVHIDKANRVKSDFLARMNHEMKTPMNSIIGMTHLVLDSELNSKQRDYLSKAEASAQSLLAIINDVLDFSKTEQGELTLERVFFGLDEVMNQVTHNALGKARLKGLELLYRIEPSVPENFLGDPERWGQIIGNLVDNAIKFTDRGEVVVEVKLAKKELYQAVVLTEVRDTGIGLTNDQMGGLFRSFSQVDGSTTRKHGGTGLGLALCKRLAERMKGKIWVESQPGQGSKFSFTAALGLGAESRKAKPPAVPDLNQRRALVVDDSPTARLFLVESLKRLGLKVVSVGSGEEALPLVANEDKEGGFDIVFMDWRLPGMSGVDAVREIVTMTGLDKPPRIVMVSAHEGEDYFTTNLHESFDRYLAKPLLYSAVLDTTVSLLEEQMVRGVASSLLDFKQLIPIYGASLLWVEDKEINQEVVQGLLLQAKLNVSVARSGREALEAIQRNSFDLVLMDIELPGMDGLEVTRLIRGMDNPELKALPIVAMSSHALEGDREKAIAAGMNEFIRKPSNPMEVYETLLQCIQKRVERDKEDVESGPLEEADEGTGKLESLMTINWEKGLRQIFEKKFSTKLREGHQGVVRELQDILEAGSLEGQKSLGGLSGTSGAMTLSRVAADLERVLKKLAKAERSQSLKGLSEADSALTLNGLVADLDRLVKKFVKADELDAEAPILSLDSPETDAEGVIVESSEHSPIEKSAELQNILAELAGYLAKKQPVPCLQLIRKIEGLTFGGELDELLIQLRDQISQYRFKEAAALFQRLRDLL